MKDLDEFGVLLKGENGYVFYNGSLYILINEGSEVKKIDELLAEENERHIEGNLYRGFSIEVDGKNYRIPYRYEKKFLPVYILGVGSFIASSLYIALENPVIGAALSAASAALTAFLYRDIRRKGYDNVLIEHRYSEEPVIAKRILEDVLAVAYSPKVSDGEERTSSVLVFYEIGEDGLKEIKKVTVNSKIAEGHQPIAILSYKKIL